MSVKAATVDVSKQPPFLKHDPVMQLGEGALYRPSDSTLHCECEDGLLQVKS